jgi:AraC family transcriptional regulator
MAINLLPGRSHGKIIRSIEAADLILAEINHPAETVIPNHAHENAHFCFVLDGFYTERNANRSLECKPRSLTYRPSGEVHSDNFHHTDARVFILEVPAKWMERLNMSGLDLNFSLQAQAGQLTQLISRLYSEFHLLDHSSKLIIEGLALEMLAHAARHYKAERSPTPKWLKQALELVKARYRDKLTLDEIAGEVEIHPVHLATTFRSRYGCTVGEFIRAQRIHFVCREIAKGKQPLAHIALAAGFSSQSQLTRIFKLQIGVTPAAYKNSL